MIVNGEEGDDDLTIDDEIKTGFISSWKNTWGFITLYDENGKNSDETLFVHIDSVIHEDRHKCLRTKMEVQFKEATPKNDPKKKKAVEVCCIDGTPISFHKKNGEKDTWSRNSLSENVFRGKLKVYFKQRRYGWIAPIETISIPEKKINITQSGQIFAGIQDLDLDVDDSQLLDSILEFKIYKDKRGTGAYDVTNTGEIMKDDDPLNDGQRFLGTVAKCAVHQYVLIEPDDDLTEHGSTKKNVWCSCEDINTDARPARVAEKTKVSFQLVKTYNGVKGIDICDEAGETIVVEEEYVSPGQQEDHESCGDETFQGTVKRYNWSSGFGWIDPAKPLPEDLQQKNKNKNKKAPSQIYFHRDDLKSEDKIFGVKEGTEVEYKLYTDSKGLGAEAITFVFGAPLTGFTMPKEQRGTKRGFMGNYGPRKRFRGRGRGRGGWGNSGFGFFGRGRGRGGFFGNFPPFMRRGRRGRGKGRRRGRRGRRGRRNQMPATW